MKILHLSDLHFGTHDAHILNALHASIAEIQPDFAVISGDFTQSATAREYQDSHDFIQSLPCPALCVPGNHDIPGFNLIERFTKPYTRYKRYINADLCPTFDNDSVKIVGINSARRIVPHWNWANGALSFSQAQFLKDQISPDEKKWTICALHHPIHKVADMPIDVEVFGKEKFSTALHDQKIDIVLTGHVHQPSITTKDHNGHQAIYISASTALSNRKRGHDNGFNVLHLEKQLMHVNIYRYNDDCFSVFQQFTTQKNRS